MTFCWQARSTSKIAIKRWDDEFTVYDEVSGDTHLIGRLAGELLWAVESAHLSDTSKLVSAMAELLGEIADDQLAEEVHALLLQLASINLLEYRAS